MLNNNNEIEIITCEVQQRETTKNVSKGSKGNQRKLQQALVKGGAFRTILDGIWSRFLVSRTQEIAFLESQISKEFQREHGPPEPPYTLEKLENGNIFFPDRRLGTASFNCWSPYLSVCLRFAAISLASADIEARNQITLCSVILSSFVNSILWKRCAFGGIEGFQGGHVFPRGEKMSCFCPPTWRQWRHTKKLYCQPFKSYLDTEICCFHIQLIYVRHWLGWH